MADVQQLSADRGEADAERAVRAAFREGLVEITLDRPARKNSLRMGDMTRLHDLLADLPGGDARSVLIRGAGGAFCAGRDLAEIDRETEDARASLEETIHPLCQTLRDLPIPTVAAVEGPCLGLGFGLAMACDIVIAGHESQIGSPFSKIGLVTDCGGHHALVARVGRHRAAEVIFLGRLLDGRTAAQWGLVNRTVGNAHLLQEARAMARRIADGPAGAFAISKAILLAREAGYADTLRAEAEAQGVAFSGAEAREGLAAFEAKRKPDFRGLEAPPRTIRSDPRDGRTG